ncbi:ankyrin repeat ph and sec7 domain containing protein secg-related [Anaeramoeba ignava]|uniref:Ankyrin repeat ph and sec7 domain containing protein secg-related n=1 Tax=Anaeramoeba ignava TaxID=1746090 RepID=A0A9Q0LQQ0_ANAIG|nr:ankyrin repeat ph and sec7 domain containing protein secg-related [Anaeramoeba ignava]
MSKINSQNGNTALHLAISENKGLDVLKKLIKQGADPNLKTYYFTPLHLAIHKHRDREIIEFLLKNGAKVNELSDVSPLNLALEERLGFDVIKLLVESGADINSADNYTPLLNACLNKYELQTIEFLINSKAEINKITGDNPLLLSVIGSCSLDVVKFLIDKGSDLNCKNNHSVLEYALRNNLFDVADFFIEKGADLKAALAVDEYALSFHSFFQEKKTNPLVVPFFAKHGYDLDTINSQTPYYLAKYTKKELAEQLVYYGVDYEYVPSDTYYGGYRTLEVKTEDLEKWTSYQNDFDEFLKKKLVTDIEIQCIDSNVKVHSLILNARLGKESADKLVEIFHQEESKNIDIFLNFVYSGKAELKNREFIEETAKKIGLENWKQKLGRFGLSKDYKKLMEDESTKDFSIICEEKPIKVHKIILMIRSGLFSGMFQSVEDDSNQVSDYSQNSQESLQTLLYYLYTDELPEEVSPQVKEKLSEAFEYYQFNMNSNFNDLLSKK